MNFLRENETIINRLAVRSAATDALALKLRFERLFGAENITPAGLPAKAIVCIKRLRDPAPRVLNLDRNASRFSGAWQTAVSREIEKLFRFAVRPLIETVPAHADSVIFLDRAELLACLASDWCENSLYQKWWWQSLFPDLERTDAVTKIWLEAAEYVPEAVKILTENGKVVEFVNGLEATEIREILSAVINAFNLHKIYKLLTESIPEKILPDSEQDADSENFSVLKKDAAKLSSVYRGILEIVPEIVSADLSAERKIFLAVALMIVRSPRIARSEKFARELKDIKVWSAVLRATANRTGKIYSIEKSGSRKQSSEKSQTGSADKKEKIRIEFERKEIDNSEKPKSIFNENLQADENLRKAEIKREKNNRSFDEKTKENIVEKNQKTSLKTEPEKRITPEKNDAQTPKNKSEFEKFITPQTSAEVLLQTAEISETESFETVIRTKYGGVFFLLNFGLYLKLYRDFSEPLGDELELNIWDFIALLSRRFTGENLERDAVWNLLKRLAGRDVDEGMTTGFSETDEWRMPVEWLKTFPANGKWFWSKTGNRLLVRHAENFNVLDVSADEDFERQLNEELRIYKNWYLETEEKNLESFYGENRASENWLKNFFEFAEVRLLQALNLDSRDQINKILLERSATVKVSATHLEAVFSLSDLPLAVRFSGLDRDPGWIPAAGKYIKFHFA